MPKINETLRKIAEDTSKVNSPISSNTEPTPTRYGFPGDPNCPICGGVGFVRRNLPIGDPNFGKLEVCSCRQDEVDRSIHQRLYRFSNLDALRHMTFETFNARGRVGVGEDQSTSLNYAFNQSRHYSQELKGWLLLMGDYGCGKTHLAASVANAAVEAGVPTLFLTVPDLLDWLRFSFGSEDASFEERFEEIRNIQLLVLDDLGTQNATAWAQEKLFQIINHRYQNRLPLVVTTNLTLEGIEGRVRSRLQDTDLVTSIRISAPDYRSPTRDSIHPPLSTLQMHAERTFGSFSLRENERLKPDEQSSLEKAFRAAKDFAENPHGWLLLVGDYGCGKTHLAAAIGNYRLGQGVSPMFVVVPDLLDHLRATFSPNSLVSYDNLFEQVRTTPLLILDGLEIQSATPWAREKLYQIINYRYNAELPTVITTASRIEDIDPRIRARLMDMRLCKNLAIMAPPYRGMGGTKARRVKKTI